MSDQENAAIELHDSDVADFRFENERLIIQFAPAYVHRSKGTPCVDPGTGWNQDALMVLSNAKVTGRLPRFPCNISDGSLSVGDRVYAGYLPAPFVAVGDVTLELEFIDGSTIRVSADELRLDLIGEPVFVEVVDLS